MQTPQRRIDPPVIERLQREPYRFEFFQAVRILEFALLQRQERDVHRRLVPGERMVPQRLRFRNSMSLGFPPSEIEGLLLRNAAGEAVSQPDWLTLPDPDPASEAIHKIELTPAFFGMLGASGALPVTYTEMLLRREQNHRDSTARAFLDIFTNRAAALFYAAWRKYRLPLHYEHERSRVYLPALLALSGLEHHAQRQPLREGAGPVFDETVAGYAAAVQHRPMSAVFLQRVLSDYFKSRIRVEQFIGKWYDVPRAQMSQFGGANLVLGRTALAGARVWQRDLRLRLWIGPLQRAQFREFFPGRAHAKALGKMLALLAGVTVEYEVRLILAKEAVRSLSLDPAQGSHLGWDSFVSTRPAEEDRSDTSYELQPLNP